MPPYNFDPSRQLQFQPMLSNAGMNPAEAIGPSMYGFSSPDAGAPSGGWGDMQNVMTPGFDASNYMTPANGFQGSGGGGGWFDNFLDSKDANGMGIKGWGSTAISAANGIASAYLGMKQYGLAKKTFNENKRQFDVNYAAQKNTTNARLEDRQKARLAASPGGNHASTADYMKKYGVA